MKILSDDLNVSFVVVMASTILEIKVNNCKLKTDYSLIMYVPPDCCYR